MTTRTCTGCGCALPIEFLPCSGNNRHNKAKLHEMGRKPLVRVDRREPLDWEFVVHLIAQGAINVSEGGTLGGRRGCFIASGSRIHRAMEDFCTYMCRLDENPEAREAFLEAIGEATKKPDEEERVRKPCAVCEEGNHQRCRSSECGCPQCSKRG